MEVAFDLEPLPGGERMVLSLPQKVELTADELSAFIEALTRVRDGLPGILLRDDEVCHLCGSGRSADKDAAAVPAVM